LLDSLLQETGEHSNCGGWLPDSAVGVSCFSLENHAESWQHHRWSSVQPEEVDV